MLFLILIIIFHAALIYFNASEKCLPAIHKDGGSREIHDDFFLLKTIPRWATSYCIYKVPILILGNQKFWQKFGSFEVERGVKKPGNDWGPKPVPRPGEWQFTLVPTGEWNIYLPYLSFSTKTSKLDGKYMHFRIGARWSDGYPENYITYPSIAVRRFVV